MGDVTEGSIIPTQEMTEHQSVEGTNVSGLSINNDSIKSVVGDKSDVVSDSKLATGEDSPVKKEIVSDVDMPSDSGNHVNIDSGNDAMADSRLASTVEELPIKMEIVPDADVLNDPKNLVNIDSDRPNDVSDSRLATSEDSSFKKEIVSDMDLNIAADEEQQLGSMKVEEDDHDFLSEDFMDHLDVVDSWVDTTDNIESPSNELNATTDSQAAADVKSDRPTKEVDEKDSGKRRSSSDKDKNKSNDSVRNERTSGHASQDKKTSEKDSKSTDKNNVQDKKTSGRDASEQNRNRNSDRTSSRREHDSRRERSPNKSSKSGDTSRRNTDRAGDRGITSVTSRTLKNSRSKRSRTRSRERDDHYNSRRNHRGSQRSGDPEPHSSRTAGSYQKRERSQDRDKRSVKSQSSTGKDATKPNAVSGTGKSGDVNPLMFKKIPPADDLVPPGTEDDVITKADDKFLPQFLVADALVPPGTEEVLLPDVVDQNSSSSQMRKASNPDSNKSKSKGAERQNSQSEREKRGTEKRRRLPSTGADETVRKKQALGSSRVERELSGRERIARDQDRISRELSLERLREGRTRGRVEREKERERERYPNRNRSYRRDEKDMRSGSYERRPEAKWDRPERRAGELSPVSPGCMSRGSPMSFEFSPVSSRSSSRERLRAEYQRGKFRSYSPISSGSNLSRSMDPISSDEERDPRGNRRRRRLPFLDEMERKLGLKLTGGHNINQKLRASQHIPPDFNMGIDVSAPPPGTYPVSYPPPVSYNTPFPQAAQYPMYPTPTFIPIPPAASEPHVIRAPHVTGPAIPSPSSQMERQLVSLPRAPVVTVTYKFKRTTPAEQPECPNAPPPPSISGGVVKDEMSLSSLLEASVKGTLDATKASEALRSTEAAGTNPVDESRVLRCQVAIQTLQEDESFSMITMGRFVVQPASSVAYTPVARFDHPAQESMFKLKSPLLRNRPVGLKFTTPPVYKEKGAVVAAVSPPKSSVWPKNSERKVEEKIEAPEKTDEEEMDVWIVEKTETVVSISSESDHALNLSPVSDVSEVSEAKLENVSSGEEDFNQCATCAERSREKTLVNFFTQTRPPPAMRSVGLQVDLVDRTLTGSFDVEPKPRRRRPRRNRYKPSPNRSVHSNTSISSDEATRPTAETFLASVSDKPAVTPAPTNLLYSNLPAATSTNQSSANQTLASSYKPFSISTNKFPGKSVHNLNLPKAAVDPVKPFQANQSAPSGLARTDNAIKLTTLNSGTMMGILSKPAPTRGILKPSRPVDVQPTSGANDFPPAKFQSSLPFQGGNVAKLPVFLGPNVKSQQVVPPFQAGNKPTQLPFRNQGNTGQQQSFQGGNMSRQPFLGNTASQNQQSIGGQSFSAGNMSRQPFLGNTTSQNQQPMGGQTFQGGNMARQPFLGNTSSQNQQPMGGQSFQGGNMSRQPFLGNTTSQNQQPMGGQTFQGGNMSRQPFLGNANNQSQSGMGGTFQSYGSFAPQTANNTNFGSRFGTTGNVPTIVPPPTAAPLPTFNQQGFQRPSEGLGMNPGPTGLNSDQRQTFFNSPSMGQQNYYDRERY